MRASCLFRQKRCWQQLILQDDRTSGSFLNIQEAFGEARSPASQGHEEEEVKARAWEAPPAAAAARDSDTTRADKDTERRVIPAHRPTNLSGDDTQLSVHGRLSPRPRERTASHGSQSVTLATAAPTSCEEMIPVEAARTRMAGTRLGGVDSTVAKSHKAELPVRAATPPAEEEDKRKWERAAQLAATKAEQLLEVTSDKERKRREAREVACVL